MASTAKASSPAAGEIAMFGLAVAALPVVPPAVGLVDETPRRRIVAQTCLAVPLANVAVIVWAPVGIDP
jgi:hypothetical protein